MDNFFVIRRRALHRSQNGFSSSSNVSSLVNTCKQSSSVMSPDMNVLLTGRDRSQKGSYVSDTWLHSLHLSADSSWPTNMSKMKLSSFAWYHSHVFCAFSRGCRPFISGMDLLDFRRTWFTSSWRPSRRNRRNSWLSCWS